MEESASKARRDGGDRRPVVLLIVALLFVAVLLVAGPVGVLEARPTRLHVPWPALVVLFAVTEVVCVRLQFRREAHTVTLTEIPLVLGLFTTDPAQLVLAHLVGSGLALLYPFRQTGVVLLLNLALFTLDVAVAVLVFDAFAGTGVPTGLSGMWATFMATLAFHLVDWFVVTAAITLTERRFHARQVRQLAVDCAIATIANTSFALVGVTVLLNDPQVAWLLLVVGAVLYLAYRAYESLRRQHQVLEALHQFTRNVGQPERVGSVVRAVLTETEELLKAERAELVPLDALGVATGAGTGEDNDAGERPATTPSDEELGIPKPDESQPLVRLLTARLRQGISLRLRHRDADPLERQALEDAGTKEVMAAPVTQTTGNRYALVVRDRRGDIGGFSNDDLELLETLAGQAAVAIERDRLFISLRREAAEREHQALHDALTGLPNRRAFGEAVEGALAALAVRRDGTGVGVLLLDVDRFKDVNDTFGHHHGDLLLRQVGERLARGLPGDVLVARIGGDEFALLAPTLREGMAEAVRLAERVLDLLKEPLDVQGTQIEVTVSIGVAVGPDQGARPSVLLQRADVALYAAKEAHTGVEAYRSELDRANPRHLMLVGPLRAAIERREIKVVYQPKALLRNGRVVGAEALVRWKHPRFGFIPPDEFIHIAESTGLIRPLGLMVTETAVRQALAWRAAGRQFGVAVNLSVRNLLDPNLVPFVIQLLEETGLPPDLLTFELTEGHMMADPEHAIEMLAQLRQTGAHLAVDDFGTGYSSLAYLKRLPIDEVKIDRSFVMNMTNDPADAAIVQSTVELAHALGLSVVAEGVEDQAAWDRLEAMGCDLAQGYFLGRPMPPDELLATFPPSRRRRDIPAATPDEEPAALGTAQESAEATG